MSSTDDADLLADLQKALAEAEKPSKKKDAATPEKHSEEVEPTAEGDADCAAKPTCNPELARLERIINA